MGDHGTELNENVIVGKPLSPRTGTESALSSKREGHNNVHWYAELELYLQSINECVPDLSTLTWGLWIIHHICIWCRLSFQSPSSKTHDYLKLIGFLIGQAKLKGGCDLTC